MGSIDQDARNNLLSQLAMIDLDAFFYSVRTGLTGSDGQIAPTEIAPLEESLVHRLSDQASPRFKDGFIRGLQKISEGKVAACVLAGGQGSRMGLAVDESKGMLEIKSGNVFVFEIFIKRLLRLRELARLHHPQEADMFIPLLVMTSPLNHNKTEEFFARHEYFGYPREAISVFMQGTLPAVSLEGELLLESPSSLVLAPDGNGGIYRALVESGNLDKLDRRGVEVLHVFSVDNILSRVCDPFVIGNFNGEIANKVVWKRSAREKVGVFAKKNGKISVVEYSDLVNPELGIYNPLVDAIDEQTKSLLLGAGNICSHFYSVKFLKQTIPKLQRNLHLAVKKIPCYDFRTETVLSKPPGNNGVKLESFIFDAFEEAEIVQLFEVDREAEFCPMKNLTGEDSLESGNAVWSAMIDAASKLNRHWSQIYPGEESLSLPH